MKKFRALFFCVALFLIALAVTGCSSGDKEVNKEDDTSTVDSEVDETSSDKEQENKEKDQAESDEANSSEQDGTNDSDQDSSDGEDGTSEESSSDSKDDQSDDEVSQNEDAASQDDGVDLSAYSAEEIEYARVWQQLGPNQNIDTLYVTKFSKGTPINPNHEDASATYPEDVIMLQGSRVVDGAVTYSGNGDGTINVYKVPARWNDKLGAKVDKNEIKESTEMIAKDTKKVSIKPFANDDIVELIKKIKIN
ncbi:outer membrane murein-binding lipoprotein Lpp [Rossellomorea marisflavi]